MNVSAAPVTRWKRYGKDRLYVSLGDETPLGFWDLVADQGHPEAPELMPSLAAVVEDWRRTQVPEAAPETVAAPKVAVALDPPPARPWLDLAANEPGQEARERAVAARQAAPVKTFVARALGVHTEERAWRIGADGEGLVGTELARLVKADPRWRTLHAVPVGTRGSDIDHVVVGPGGVFTVNAKHHPRAAIWVGGQTFLVNGQRTSYIRNSRHEASRAARLLTAACGFPVHVEGLIVTVNAKDVVVKAPSDGVQVTWRKNLGPWLRRHGDLHDEATVDAIFEAARRSTTWQSRPSRLRREGGPSNVQ